MEFPAVRSRGRLIPAEDQISLAWGCRLLLAGVVPPGRGLLAALMATSLWAHPKGQRTPDPPRESCCRRGSLYPSIKDMQTQRAVSFLFCSLDSWAQSIGMNSENSSTPMITAIFWHTHCCDSSFWEMWLGYKWETACERATSLAFFARLCPLASTNHFESHDSCRYWMKRRWLSSHVAVSQFTAVLQVPWPRHSPWARGAPGCPSAACPQPDLQHGCINPVTSISLRWRIHLR